MQSPTKTAVFFYKVYKRTLTPPPPSSYKVMLWIFIAKNGAKILGNFLGVVYFPIIFLHDFTLFVIDIYISEYAHFTFFQHHLATSTFPQIWSVLPQGFERWWDTLSKGGQIVHLWGGFLSRWDKYVCVCQGRGRITRVIKGGEEYDDKIKTSPLLTEPLLANIRSPDAHKWQALVGGGREGGGRRRRRDIVSSKQENQANYQPKKIHPRRTRGRLLWLFEH